MQNMDNFLEFFGNLSKYCLEIIIVYVFMCPFRDVSILHLVFLHFIEYVLL